MDYDKDNDEDDEEKDYKQSTHSPEAARDHHGSSPDEDEESLVDEFDDFEEVAAVDGFGDFDEGVQQPDVVEKDIQPEPVKQIPHITMTPFVSSTQVICNSTLFQLCA